MSEPPTTTEAPFRCPDELRAHYLDAYFDAALDATLGTTPALDAALDDCARDARSQDVPPERFLVAVTECLIKELPVSGISPAQRELRQRTMTRAIDAYYGPAGM